MDRKKVVYYHRKVQLESPRLKKKRQQSLLVKSLAAAVFVLFFGLLSIRFSSPTEEGNKVLADSTTLPSTEKIVPKSPLVDLVFPTIGQSAVGTLEQGIIKVSENEAQAPIASVTKVITALVILEKKPLQRGERGDSIPLTEKDLQYFNDYFAKLGTVTAVTVGESMTQYEALQAMLLPSSNNMSDTLVDYYFSNRDEYIKAANNYLKEKGLNKTVVADASGFSPESKSTPSDLIRIGQLALNNPVIREIVGQQYATIAVAGDIPNYNALIKEPNVIGIKPGATDEAGYCLLFAAAIPDKSGTLQTVIAVTMNHPDRNEYIAASKQMLENIRTIVQNN